MIVSYTSYGETSPLFYQIVANSQTGVIVFEAIRDDAGEFLDFRFVFINRVGAAILGKTPEQLTGHPYLAHFVEAESISYWNVYRQVLETGQDLHLPEIACYTDGINAWFDLRVSKYGNALVLTYNDITAFKRSQLTFEAQALQLRTTLDASISSIFYMTAIRNEQGQIVDFLMVMSNQAVMQSTKRTPDQVEGQPLLKVFPGNVENGFFALYVRVTETGQPERSTRYYRDDVGLEGWFEVSAVKQGDGVVVTFMNITEQKKIESELQQKNEALERSNQSLQSFAYIASHDLQEPLRKLQAFSDILTNDYQTDLKPEALDILQRMKIATRRMATLVHDLLAFSRITTQPRQEKSVSLSNVISGVIGDLDLIIQETSATIDVETLPVITGDELELGQLFQNLLSNALKFRRPTIPPVIAITCLVIEAHELPESVKTKLRKTRYCQISVSDNGIGFEPKNADRIFEMFQRLHPRSKFEGTGIGLAICQKVAENHGGAIIATSEPDQGASFHVYLPLNPVALAEF
ncbi:hypothetical protein GCM10028803_14830 [Larkinella knui]|uniref:histidine kinase n=1 Tax=Larkinella knui TaxID=2025310 RepID=A0A3P1C9C2_9BACT|nr:ATP-binding protein [Larkinella knui]RRB09857.1 hypothetical protein EHT87_30520 [Larkinella knui]